MKPEQATLEPNFHNSDACTVVLYFNGEPAKDDVVNACKTGLDHLALGVDTTDQFFQFEEHETAVSKKAGLRRFEIYPTG